MRQRKLMEKHSTNLETLEFISQPENIEIRNFLLATLRYHTQYGLDEIFQADQFLLQCKILVEYFNKPPFGIKAYYKIKTDIYNGGFNDFDRFIILDIITKFLYLLQYKAADFDTKQYAVENLTNEKNRIAKKIAKYSQKEIKTFCDLLLGKPTSVQLGNLYCYKRQLYRIANLEQASDTTLIQTIDKIVSHLQQNPSTNESDNQKILFDEFIPEQKTQEYSDKEKLSIKDVAVILKYHESHVRRLLVRKSNPLPHYRDTPRGRMYFFYPEILEWMKSNRQVSQLEEAGNVFRRKSKGAVKTRRPRMK